MDDQLCGFMDESKKPVRDPRTGKVAAAGDFYVVAAAVVLRGEVEDTRSELRNRAEDLGIELHYNDLGRERRIAVVERIVAIESWDGYLFRDRPTPDSAAQLRESPSRPHHAIGVHGPRRR